MARQSDAADPLGFLTVVEHPQHGLFGGYLLLNAAGRPLEFHCTAPIRASRAQEILYGPTLRPYLFGEQIGKTLYTHAAHKPQFVLTDVAPAMELAAHVPTPVVLVDTADEAGNLREPDSLRSGTSPTAPPSAEPGARALAAAADRGDRIARLDAAHGAREPLGWHVVAGRRVALAPYRPADAPPVVLGEELQRLEQLAARLDLAEPFERIRRAIEEAQQGSRA